MPPAKHVTVVIVSYRNNEILVDLLRHLQGFHDEELPSVVVVANGLDDASRSHLLAASSGILAGRLHVIASSHNPGYFAGAQIGLDHLTATEGLPRWVIVANDDIRFAPDFFTQLQIATSTERVAAVAPDIFVPDSGIHQNPLYAEKPSVWRIRLLRLIHANRFSMLLYIAVRKAHRRSRPSSFKPKVTQIYAPHGACLVFHQRYFELGGDLRHPCFLYGEEFFIAETVRRLGLQIWLAPDLRLEHREHTTTGRMPSTAMLQHVRHSLDHILERYYT